MANIPSISHSSLTYSAPKRVPGKRTQAADATGDSPTAAEETNPERRRQGDRRHRQIRVLYNRRQSRDRRNQSLKSDRKRAIRPADGNQGRNINTTA